MHIKDSINEQCIDNGIMRVGKDCNNTSSSSRESARVQEWSGGLATGDSHQS
jgi:hypothetical protein